MVNFSIDKVTDWTTIIKIQLLSIISGTKANHTFLEKSYTKCGEEASLRHFYNKS